MIKKREFNYYAEVYRVGVDIGIYLSIYNLLMEESGVKLPFVYLYYLQSKIDIDTVKENINWNPFLNTDIEFINGGSLK